MAKITLEITIETSNSDWKSEYQLRDPIEADYDACEYFSGKDMQVAIRDAITKVSAVKPRILIRCTDRSRYGA